MKFFIAFACLLALTYANENANVLHQESEVNVDGFKYRFELDNSNKQEQESHLQGESAIVTGKFSHNTPEGVQVSIQYTADENGYHVESANPPLPTPPPIPEAIQRAIEYIKNHPQAE